MNATSARVPLGTFVSTPVPVPRDDRMRVLHVISTLMRGGSELSVLRLASAMNPRRVSVRVAWLRGEPDLREEFRSAGIEVVPMGMRAKLDPACLWRLRGYVARERIDVVHTHMDVADFYGALAGRLGGARCVVSTKHAPDEFRTRRTWKRTPFLLLERLAYRMDDAVIVVSEGLADFLGRVERLPRRKMVVIGHGVDAGSHPVSVRDAKEALGLPPFAPVVGMVGRLSPEKGHEVVLRALPEILAELPKAGCFVAGEGPSLCHLEAEAKRLGVADRVAFLGFRRDVPDLLPAIDLFVQPSLYEGFGMSLLEAMASGLPIVASRVGGIPELVEDGRTGILVPPSDPQAIAAAVIRLWRDRAAARRMGEEARNCARERHGLATVAARVEGLYRDILGRRG